MPNGMLPPGYRAVLIGSAATLEGLSTIAPLEESVAEGGLMLMRLDFTGYPSDEVLTELETALEGAGVRKWPGNQYVVYADTAAPSIYLAWQKGIAWMPIIIGILVVTVLPVLLGGIIWLILPSGIKELIELAGMMLVMFGIMKLMKPMMAPAKEEKPKMLAPAEEKE